MKFSRVLFLVAGIYGLVALLPQYFFPAPAEKPEFFFGFIGVAAAWQLLFLIMSRDPLRYRMVMIPAVLEKAAFGLPVLVLYAQGRVPVQILAAGIIDLIFAALFAVAFRMTRESRG
jgi:hypothetical protein